MPRYDLSDIARRLDAILKDLGYVVAHGGDHADRARALRVINRRLRAPIRENRFIRLCQGAEMTAEEAVKIADGLRFDVRRLLYDEGNIPRRPEKPRSLLDEIDAAGSPM